MREAELAESSSGLCLVFILQNKNKNKNIVVFIFYIWCKACFCDSHWISFIGLVDIKWGTRWVPEYLFPDGFCWWDMHFVGRTWHATKFLLRLCWIQRKKGCCSILSTFSCEFCLEQIKKPCYGVNWLSTVFFLFCVCGFRSGLWAQRDKCIVLLE